jgi:hypothetical protein
MSKIELDPIASGYNLDVINNNFQKIEDELNNKVLYRTNPSGQPNQMSNNLDMNGKAIINASNIGGGGGAVAAEDVSFVPVGTIESTNVQDAVAEVLGDIPTAAINFPLPVGIAAQIGVSTRYAREDHVHVGDGSGGGGGGDAISTGLAYAYQRAVSMPVGMPGDVVFTFASATITTPASNALLNGWTKLIPAGSNPLWVTVASASATTSTDTIFNSEWATPVILSQDGTDGVNGLNVATVYLYQRSATATPVPAVPSANVTYQFNPPVVTGLTNGWQTSVPNISGGAFLFVTQATAVSTGTTDIITPSEWAAVQIMAQNGANGSTGPSGANGTRGTVNIAQGGRTSWSDAVAVSAISAAGYGSPIERDIVTQYGTGFSQTRFYTGGVWTILTAYINGNLLVSGTIAASSIAADTFTGQEYRTATSGQRIHINLSGNNKFQAYNSSGTVIAEIGSGSTGGGSAYILGTSLNPSLYVTNSGSGAGIYSVTGSSSADAISGSSGSTTYAAGSFSNSATNGAAIYINGRVSTQAKSSGLGIAAMNEVLPVSDNTYACGAASNRWSVVYAATGTINTSDARIKTDVQSTDLGLSFVKALRPVKFKFIEGHKTIVESEERGEYSTVSVPGTRYHYGFIAQEVKEALGEIDSGIWCLTDKDDPDSIQQLRENEIVPSLVKAIQELEARIAALEAK